MATKTDLKSYLLATIASICFVSGLLVLTGGEDHEKGIRHDIHDRPSS